MPAVRPPSSSLRLQRRPYRIPLRSRCTTSTTKSKPLSPKPYSQSTSNPDASAQPFNLLAQIRASSRPVRYTIYTGLALMVTAETTFWSNIIYAKYFASAEKKDEADQLLERVREAVQGYRARWMVNYGEYWAGGLWGL